MGVRKSWCSFSLSDLDVGAGLVGHLHDKLAAALGWLAHQVVEDVQVHGGAQVVDVGDEHELLPLRDQLLQQSRVIEAGIDVTVTWGIPRLRVLPTHTQSTRHRQQGLLIYSGIPAERESERQFWVKVWILTWLCVCVCVCTYLLWLKVWILT